MEISIEYSSKWGNSFLSEQDEKGNRSYIASLSKMNDGKNKENQLGYYKERDISISTVYGILYRLLGARKSLKKILEEDDSFVSELIKQNKISFIHQKLSDSDESVYIKNKELNNDQNSYSGIPDDSITEFDGFKEAIDVLYYNREQLIEYITKDKTFDVEDYPLHVIDFSNKIKEVFKNKNLIVSELEYNAINKMNKKIFNQDIDAKKAHLGLIAINKSINNFANKHDEVLRFLTPSKTITGISLNGKSLTPKDVMKNFANYKIVYGNPYQTDFWVKNEVNGKNKKFNKKLTKSNGKISISIDCEYESSLKLKKLIENSGTSSFYVGKKGLGYIRKITV
jgi:hypothetical protein